MRIEQFRSDDERVGDVPLERDLRTMVSRAGNRVRLSVTADGRSVAIAAANRVYVSRNAGLDFSCVELPNPVALAFGGDTGDCRLLVLSAPSLDESSAPSLVEIPARGEPTLLAEIGLSLLRDEGPAATTTVPRWVRASSTMHLDAWARSAIAWDSTREALWIACPLGLLAFGPTRKH